jgi:hypothetical protein
MKYMLTFFGEEGDWGDVSPEEMQAQMKRWDDYTAALKESGSFIAGEGLQPSSTATTVKYQEGADPITVDGPFAETKEQLGGFYLIDVEDLDAALEWARRVPARSGSGTEVRPVMDYEAIGGSAEHTSSGAAA